MLRLLMYVSFSGLTLKQFFDIIQGEVRKNRSLKEHSGFATTAIHATRSASLRRFYLLTEKSQTCGLVSVLFQSLLMTLNLIRPSSIGVWVQLKPLFEEKLPWPLPVLSDSVQLTDSLVSGDMKLILFTICFSIKQRRTRRRGRLRIVVLKIRTLALSLLARTSDSDSEEVGAVPTEPAILRAAGKYLNLFHRQVITTGGTQAPRDFMTIKCEISLTVKQLPYKQYYRQISENFWFKSKISHFMVKR